MINENDKKMLLWAGVIIATIAIVIARVVTLKQTLVVQDGKVFNIVQPIKNLTHTVSNNYAQLKSTFNKVDEASVPVANPSPAPTATNNDVIPLIKARLEQELNNKTNPKTP